MSSDRNGDPVDGDAADRDGDAAGRDGGDPSRDLGDRDRDPSGRARNARPRDALGRPLPHGAAGEDRLPEGVVRSPDESLALAQALLDAGRPFAAHEVLEDAWKSAPEAERQLWRGLAQLAVGLTHALRGNSRGAAALLERGAGNVAPYAAAPPHGIDAGSLARWGRATATAVGGVPVEGDRLTPAQPRPAPPPATPSPPAPPRLRR